MTEQIIEQLRDKPAQAQEQYEFIIDLARRANVRLMRDLVLARENLARAHADHKQSTYIIQEENTNLAQSLMQVRAELTAACAARDALAQEQEKRNIILADAAKRVSETWLSKAQEQSAELAQLRRQLTVPVQTCGYCGYRYSAGTNKENFDMMAEHIKSCPEHPLTRALAKLAQARSELKDLQGANRAFGQHVAAVKENRDYWYDKAADAEAGRDKWRGDWESATAELLNAQARLAAAQEAAEWLWGFWDGNALVAKPGYEDDIRETWSKLLMTVDSVDDMPLERLATLDAAEAEQDELRGRLSAAQEKLWNEHQLRQEAQPNAGTLRLMIAGISEALDECGVGHYYYRDLDDEGMSTRTRVLLLGQRAEHAESALQSEHGLRQEAERICEAMSEMARNRGTRLEKARQRAETFYQELTGAHEALDECQVRHNYGDGEQASIRTRIFWLNTREGRAEALAQLVSRETAELLIQLVSNTRSLIRRADWGEITPTGHWHRDAEAGYTLATRIKEALDDSQA